MPRPESSSPLSTSLVVPQPGAVISQGSSSLAQSQGNGSVKTALGVLELLAAIGETAPFIAPVFVLLKIIIDVERSAEDVDAKCNDLMDRISFMLSHLPLLKDIEIMPATRTVVERVIEALKEAAALISSYRKQSPLARRLSFSNRERFSLCVDHVNSCCNDLLMSLQIHQSVQLDILTRAVPLDNDDQAAFAFIEEHGGDFEAIQYDRELVREFAEQNHLTVDDGVMEDLGRDIAESMTKFQGRVEVLLQENVAKAIANGFQSLAPHLVVPEVEQRFVCVQCEHEFTRSTNGPKACSFHRAEYEGLSKSHPCCGSRNPCNYDSHREKHHCDYPYGNFFPRAWAIRNWPDTTEEWVSLQDIDLEDSSKVQRASMSRLLRWKHGASRVHETVLLLSVGRVHWQAKYFWETITVKQLDNISKSVRHSKRDLIFRTSPSTDEYAMAEWLVATSGMIAGIRLTVKAATSTTPFVRVIPIDVATGMRSGDVVEVSNGGLRSYTPASPYVLPKTLIVGPELSGGQVRPPRTDFRTKSAPSLRVILRGSGNPPLKANTITTSAQHDFYAGFVSVFNNNAPGSNMPVTIADAKAMYRMVGETEYNPVRSFTLMNSQLPLTIDPRQSSTFAFEAIVPRTEEDAKADILWRGQAFGARHRPLRLKVIFEDIEGEECSIVMEYVFTPLLLDEKKDSDLGFIYFDDPQIMARRCIRVQPPNHKDNVVQIGGKDIETKRLQQLVHAALKTGVTEIDLEIGREMRHAKHGEWRWDAWVLVDTSCRSVYAFKIMLQEGKSVEDGRKQFGCIGYVACPAYGDIMEDTRPIAYAAEKEHLPSLQPYSLPNYPQDDLLDNVNPAVPLKLQASDIVASGTLHARNSGGLESERALEVLEDMSRRLTSLDNNVTKIAGALEQLVSLLQSRT